MANPFEVIITLALFDENNDTSSITFKTLLLSVVIKIKSLLLRTSLLLVDACISEFNGVLGNLFDK